jgi:hypothetical protein
MSAVNAAPRLENVEIFSDGDLGGAKTFGQCANQHTSIVIQHLQDQSAAFFVQHRLTQVPSRSDRILRWTPEENERNSY